VILDVAPGTTCGNHRADFPRHPGASQGMVSAGQAHEADSLSWTFLWAVFALQARGFVGSNPTVPTFFEYLSSCSLKSALKWGPERHCLSGKNVNRSRRVAGQAGGLDMSEIYPAMVGQELCDKWMPRKKTTCARTPGHGGPCKTAEVMERQRAYSRSHPHRESRESRKGPTGNTGSLD
jgi:hypothetical protein